MTDMGGVPDDVFRREPRLHRKAGPRKSPKLPF